MKDGKTEQADADFAAYRQRVYDALFSKECLFWYLLKTGRKITVAGGDGKLKMECPGIANHWLCSHCEASEDDDSIAIKLFRGDDENGDLSSAYFSTDRMTGRTMIVCNQCGGFWDVIRAYQFDNKNADGSIMTRPEAAKRIWDEYEKAYSTVAFEIVTSNDMSIIAQKK